MPSGPSALNALIVVMIVVLDRSAPGRERTNLHGRLEVVCETLGVERYWRSLGCAAVAAIAITPEPSYTVEFRTSGPAVANLFSWATTVEIMDLAFFGS